MSPWGRTLHARRIALTTALGAVTLALTAPVFGGVAVAATERTVVTESDITRQTEDSLPLDNWVFFTRAAAPAVGTFREGPASPPYGSGSFEIATATDAHKGYLFNFDHVGTQLADIDAMGYSTFRSAGRLQQLTSINIQVDYNGSAAGGFTTLVFEPVYNAQGDVVSGLWQHWDAYNGGQAIWWSSSPIPGAPNRDTFVTWDTITAENPNAAIVRGYGLNQGSYNPALVTATDALRLSHGKVDVTYDFEVDPLPPTDKDQCKDGGYLEFSNPSFKNQGECVSYVQRGDKGSGRVGGEASSVAAAKLAALSRLG